MEFPVPPPFPPKADIRTGEGGLKTDDIAILDLV